jgi:hypothetical protein
MSGPFKHKTPGYALESLYGSYKRGDDPMKGGGGTGLRTGGLSTGSSLTPESDWRAMFPGSAIHPSASTPAPDQAPRSAMPAPGQH